MNLKLLIFTFIIFFLALPHNTQALSYNHSFANETPVIEQGQNPPVKKSKKGKRIKKAKVDKKFPLYGTLSVSAAVLTLLMLGLGIFLRFNIVMGILAAILALTALTLAIIGLKKGESKSFNFIGIMIGAVGLLGAIFFAISVSS